MTDKIIIKPILKFILRHDNCIIAIFDTSRSAEGKHEHERPLARVRVFSRSTTYECRKCIFGTSAPNGILGAAAPNLKKR